MAELNSAITKGWSDELQRYIWYVGDTFDFVISVELVDGSGQPLEIQPGDKLIVEFRNSRNQIITTFESEIDDSNCSIVCEFNEDTTRKFGVGVYSFIVKFRDRYITTIGVDNYCEVISSGPSSY